MLKYQLQVCEDCDQQETFKNWDDKKVNQRPLDFQNKKVEDNKKIQEEPQGFKAPEMLENQLKVCEDCIVDQHDTIKNWDDKKVNQRPLDFQNKKVEDLKKIQEQVNKSQEPPSAFQEEEKQQTGNVFILMQQQALKYKIDSQTWSLIELKFDSSLSHALNEEQICQFNLISSSSGCAQLHGLQKRDLLITGGVIYQQLSFYASINPIADAITISSGPNLIVDRHSHAVAVRDQNLKSEEAYLVGGIELSKQVNNEEEKGIKLTHYIEVLNLKQNKEWEILKDLKLKYGRVSPSALVLGNYLYVLGGFSQKHICTDKLPEYTDKPYLQQFVERFDISNKKDHTLINISYNSPQNFPAASFNVIPIYSKKQIIIAGGTTGKKVLKSIFRLKLEQEDNINAQLELQMDNYHADSMISRVSDVGMYIFGGAESQGCCEFVNFEQKQTKPIFDFYNCLEKASTTQGIDYYDLRWSCCFFK